MLANMVVTQLNNVTMLAWVGSTGWGMGAAKAEVRLVETILTMLASIYKPVETVKGRR